MAWELDDEVAFRAEVIRASLERVRELEAMPLADALALVTAREERRLDMPAFLFAGKPRYMGPERRVR